MEELISKAKEQINTIEVKSFEIVYYVKNFWKSIFFLSFNALF